MIEDRRRRLTHSLERMLHSCHALIREPHPRNKHGTRCNSTDKARSRILRHEHRSGTGVPNWRASWRRESLPLLLSSYFFHFTQQCHVCIFINFFVHLWLSFRLMVIGNRLVFWFRSRCWLRFRFGIEMLDKRSAIDGEILVHWLRNKVVDDVGRQMDDRRTWWLCCLRL